MKEVRKEQAKKTNKNLDRAAEQIYRLCARNSFTITEIYAITRKVRNEAKDNARISL